MRGVSIVLILYATSMVFYGALEMTHDLLHQLARLQITSLHDHEHDHHHSVHDHEHSHAHHHSSVSHHHGSDREPEESISPVINFFLFVQAKPGFHFYNSGIETVSGHSTPDLSASHLLPATPPPKGVS